METFFNNGSMHGSPSTWTSYLALSQNYPSLQVFFLAGIKTIGAMMLPFGCNTSQPIPNILADTFFSKNSQVKFWPDNENVGSVLKKSDISLLQLVVNRNERCQCLYPRIFAQIFHFSHFRGDSSNRVARNCDFSFF